VTPDNASYFYAAYAIGIAIYSGYVLLLRWRERGLEQRQRAAEDMAARIAAREAEPAREFRS